MMAAAPTYLSFPKPNAHPARVASPTGKITPLPKLAALATLAFFRDGGKKIAPLRLLARKLNANSRIFEEKSRFYFGFEMPLLDKWDYLSYSRISNKTNSSIKSSNFYSGLAARAHTNLAKAYARGGDYGRAAEECALSVSILKKLGKKTSVNEAMQSYYSGKQAAKGKQYHSAAHSMERACHTLASEGKIGRALEFGKEAVELFCKTDDSVSVEKLGNALIELAEANSNYVQASKVCLLVLNFFMRKSDIFDEKVRQYELKLSFLIGKNSELG